MINYYHTLPGQRGAVETDSSKENLWIALNAPSESEIEFTAKMADVSPDLLRAALDEEERARIERDGGDILIIIDTPYIVNKDKHVSYTTMPLGIIVTQKYFISVTLYPSAVMDCFAENKFKDIDINKKFRFLHQILYRNAVEFLTKLKTIDKAFDLISMQLQRSMKNKDLMALFGLEKSLVYFSTSINSNQRVIDKIAAVSFIKNFEDDRDIINDALVENRQAIEVCNIHREIISGSVDAMASVISNNQNNVMKLLTIFTIVLAIPTLIASFFGMNTGVPFQGKLWGFFVVSGISVVIALGILFVMFRKKWF